MRPYCSTGSALQSDMLGHFNKRSQFDRPLRKNAAIDEELAGLDVRMLRPQRNIVAKRRRKVRSRARSSIGGKTDTFGIPACSTRANRASLNHLRRRGCASKRRETHRRDRVTVNMVSTCRPSRVTGRSGGVRAVFFSRDQRRASCKPRSAGA